MEDLRENEKFTSSFVEQNLLLNAKLLVYSDGHITVPRYSNSPFRKNHTIIY